MFLKNDIISLCLFLLVLTGCNKKNSSISEREPKENLSAKKALQGIWVNDGNEDDVAFRIKGDTIYYPDSTSMPVYFKIIRDSLVLYGGNITKYPIIKQSPHLFMFKNQNGEDVRFTKSSNAENIYLFEQRRLVSLNQNQLIKRDTLVTYSNERYHCYVQVNPTTYKVVKSSYNDDGVEVNNVYFDNIIHISIFKQTNRIFSKDFRKNDFSSYVQKQFLKQSVLSDMILTTVSDKGIHFASSLCIPDTQISYLVTVIISYNGKMTFIINNK